MPSPYTPASPPPGTIMTPVKQFTALASLPHVLVHLLLITILTLNMVMTLPTLG